MDANTLLIACEVVVKEMRCRIPENLPLFVLNPALHVYPDRLRKAIQDVIDQQERQYGTLLLGYGLCSRAVEGLQSNHARMIIPRVDDCIGIFLGSRAGHLDQIRKEPGTFFLSKGWIDVGSTPFEEYAYMMKRFGQKRADRLMRELLHNYTRLAFIETDCRENSSAYRTYAREKANRFGLKYEEITGEASLFDRLMKAGAFNDGCDEFLVVPSGNEVTYDMFFSK
ncbi:MAG: DUF1638 domain-containing protein [Deltaproteobacteria bacterium]|nr:DUF1638 domain-containing protein [Deltaproteobacteria bacterium]